MSSKLGKSLSRQEMKNVLGGWGTLPFEHDCVPNGGRQADHQRGCCSGASCSMEFGGAPICYDPNDLKPCPDIPE